MSSPELARQDHNESPFVLPTKLPFFKSHRKKILEAKVSELVASGPIDDPIEAKLSDFAVALGLNKSEARIILTQRFTAELEPIKQRMESSFVLTDSDLDEIETLKKKYNVNLTLAGTAPLCRAIYLLESKHELPPPVPVDIFLEASETCYYEIPTTWHQSRVQRRGYSVRTEQITALSAGMLFVTSKRLLFKGDVRSTTISLKKIVDCHGYLDGIKIEKNTGKADLFSMNAVQARFVLSLSLALCENANASLRSPSALGSSRC